jgi:hypothetical protein
MSWAMGKLLQYRTRPATTPVETHWAPVADDGDVTLRALATALFVPAVAAGSGDGDAHAVPADDRHDQGAA